jgi:hypothetical protein
MAWVQAFIHQVVVVDGEVLALTEAAPHLVQAELAMTQAGFLAPHNFSQAVEAEVGVNLAVLLAQAVLE